MSQQKRTLFFILLFVLISCTSLVRSEYIWDGSDWVWKEEKDSGSNTDSNVDGGSGDGEDDEDAAYNEVYDDDYDGGSGDGDNEDDEDIAIERNNPSNTWKNDNDITPAAGATPDNDDFEEVDNESNDNNDLYVEVTTASRPRAVDMEPIDVDNDRNGNNIRNKSSSTSFFAQPGTLAAVVGGAVVGLLCAILCVMFVVYRMRKKDEGSYALDPPKRSSTVTSYSKPPNREFFA